LSTHPNPHDVVEAALDRIPYGVSVVTLGRGGVEAALTVSWFSQVSFDPPQLMIAIDRLHYSADFPGSTRNFVLNLLGEEGKRLAGHFSRESFTDSDKLAKIASHPADSGAAILDDAVAWFDCEVVAMLPTGDHLLVIGNVTGAGLGRDGAALTSASGLRYRKSKPR